jgi:hypothetical protein
MARAALDGALRLIALVDGGRPPPGSGRRDERQRYD